MAAKHCVLIAAQPGAWQVLERMLGELFDLIQVESMVDAFLALELERSRIRLILCTVAFDDSRMLDFLHAVKRNDRTSAIPFLCCRVLPSALPNESWDRIAAVCKYAGAVDYIDLPNLEATHGFDRAALEIRNAALQCIAGNAGNQAVP
jgi:hypothetical protein